MPLQDAPYPVQVGAVIVQGSYSSAKRVDIRTLDNIYIVVEFEITDTVLQDQLVNDFIYSSLNG
jgi:hypothetical protein